jgi:hypothetical protein
VEGDRMQVRDDHRAGSGCHDSGLDPSPATTAAAAATAAARTRKMLLLGPAPSLKGLTPRAPSSASPQMRTRMRTQMSRSKRCACRGMGSRSES